MAARVSVTVSSRNAGLPLSISHSTHPNAQTSLRRIDGFALVLLRAHVRGSPRYQARLTRPSKDLRRDDNLLAETVSYNHHRVDKRHLTLGCVMNP